jgi:hypothetical protein
VSSLTKNSKNKNGKIKKLKKEQPKAKKMGQKSKGNTSGVKHPALAFSLPFF